MKRKFYTVVFLLSVALSLVAQVNGQLTQAEGKWILRTWGTHTQRGYAQGYLLAEPIMSILNSYYFQMVAMSSPTVYNNMLTFYQSNFNLEQKYTTEAQGIVEGIIASGVDAHITGLSREVTAGDVLLANCLVDMYSYRSDLRAKLLSNPGITLPADELELGCASLSSWGSATQADSLLAGSGVISRFMDWSSDDALIANPLLLISFPSEANEQPWLSFTYPGMIGALSAVSASGKAAFLNMGNVHNYDDLNNLHPILLSIRNAIESTDYNADNTDDIDDVYDAIYSQNSLSGTIIHAISETNIIQTGIIETNNQQGTMMRIVGINSGLPGMNLAATNHFRMLTNPVCCTRYQNIIDSLSANPEVSAKRQMTVLRGAAGQDTNMMAIQYVPSTGNLRWQTASLTQPAYQTAAAFYSRDELLDISTVNQDNYISQPQSKLYIYPNPARNGDHIYIKSTDNSPSILNIYNLKGQKVAQLNSANAGFTWNGQTDQGASAANGLYLLQVQSQGSKTLSGKILIFR